MKTYPTKNIRNILLLGHGGSGKTTLTEAMAFNAGAIDRMGRVDEGNTLSDFDPEEKRRMFSISSSIIPVEYGGHKINIIDVPGYFDFIGDAYAALRVADAVVIVVDALAGVQVGTEKAIELLSKVDVPAFIVVNKMDRENATFAKVMDNLKEAFGNKVIPFELPMGEGEDMRGVVNIVDMTGSQRKDNRCFDVEVPEDMKEELAPFREMIMESVAQTSEELMEKYFDGEELTEDEIHHGIRTGVLDGDLIPVLCTSAVQNIGVETLENMIIAYLPSPKDAKPVMGKDPRDGKEVERACGASESFSALVFKTIVDPFVGKLSIFKVMSGVLEATTEVYNATKEAKEKTNHIYVLRGNKQIEIEALLAGDIGAFSKLGVTVTGDTLCDPKDPIVYDKIEFPKPVISMAIEPKTKADIDKLSTGLHRLIEEDPTMSFNRNNETKQTLLSGLGEMHLEVISNKLQQKFGVGVNLEPMKVPYRETIRKSASAQGRHKKQSGGSGQFGDVWIRFEPQDESDDMIFAEEVFGGSVPKNFFPSVEKGLRNAVQKGVLAGYPLVGLKAVLYDGSYHPVDSNDMAFQTAARLAYQDGIPKAKPTILEPIGLLKVTIPDANLGDIMSDISSKRRGTVLGMTAEDGMQTVEAEVPMAEMGSYTIDLRSMTQGRGSFSCKFVRYEEAPGNVQQKVIEEAKKEQEA